MTERIDNIRQYQCVVAQSTSPADYIMDTALFTFSPKLSDVMNEETEAPIANPDACFISSRMSKKIGKAIDSGEVIGNAGDPTIIHGERVLGNAGWLGHPGHAEHHRFDKNDGRIDYEHNGVTDHIEYGKHSGLAGGKGISTVTDEHFSQPSKKCNCNPCRCSPTCECG